MNEVIAVGYGSSIWPNGLSAAQSTYNPPWVATSEADLSGDVGGSNDPTYLKNVVTSSPIDSGQEIWNNAETQKCVSRVRKEYPSDHINAFSPSAPGSQATWTGIEQACTDVTLFATIAKAAGKHLTVASFVHAGYGLRNVVIPGVERSHIVRSESALCARTGLHGPLRRFHQDPRLGVQVLGVRLSGRRELPNRRGAAVRV